MADGVSSKIIFMLPDRVLADGALPDLSGNLASSEGLADGRIYDVYSAQIDYRLAFAAGDWRLNPMAVRYSRAPGEVHPGVLVYASAARKESGNPSAAATSLALPLPRATRDNPPLDETLMMAGTRKDPPDPDRTVGDEGVRPEFSGSLANLAARLRKNNLVLILRTSDDPAERKAAADTLKTQGFVRGVVASLNNLLDKPTSEEASAEKTKMERAMQLLNYLGHMLVRVVIGTDDLEGIHRVLQRILSRDDVKAAVDPFITIALAQAYHKPDWRGNSSDFLTQDGDDVLSKLKEFFTPSEPGMTEQIKRTLLILNTSDKNLRQNGFDDDVSSEHAILLAQLASPHADAHTHAYMALYDIVLAHLIAAYKNGYSEKVEKVVMHIITQLARFNATLTPENQTAMRILFHETFKAQLEELNRLKEKVGTTYQQAMTLRDLLTKIENKEAGKSDTAQAIALIDAFSERKETSGWVMFELRRALGGQYPQDIRLRVAEALVAVNVKTSRLIAAMSDKLFADTRENADILTIFLRHPDELVKRKAAELLSAMRPDIMPELETLSYPEPGEGLLTRLARAASSEKIDGGGIEEDAVGYYDETISLDKEEDRKPSHFAASRHDRSLSKTIRNPVFHGGSIPLTARVLRTII